ncbi:MAG: 6-phosphofructokinase [Chloroflexota bacterium]
MPRTLLVGQAGGATAVINCTLAGVIDEANRSGQFTSVLGMRRAAEGALAGEFAELGSLSESKRRAIAQSPGAALGSSRHKFTDDELDLLLDDCRRRHIDTFLYIGGNDSADTAYRLAMHARARGQDVHSIALPKTIDNDLPETDHCPGFGSIARYIAIATMDSGKDTESMPTMYPVKIIEVMGRDAGWVVAAAALGKRESRDAPHLLYPPERPVSHARLLADVERVYRDTGNVVAVVAETLRDESGRPVADPELRAERDKFGHPLIRGTADAICRLVQDELGLRARFDKPGSLQRMSMLCASSTDKEEAERVGRVGVNLALNGESDCMVTLVRDSHEPYRCDTGTAPLALIANRQKLLPEHYIMSDHSDVSDAFRRYARPLLGPEPLPVYERLD